MAENGTTLPQDSANTEQAFAESKGKGKAVAEDNPQDTTMDEDDEDDDDDDEEDDENAPAVEEEDGMEEIDVNNIVPGGRTRGQRIDFAKAAEQNPAEDDDEEDDDDFQPPEEDTKMSE